MIWATSIGLVFVVYIIWFVRFWHFVNDPTKGTPISSARTTTALLLIDLQKDYLDGSVPGTAEAMACINQRIERAKSSGFPVIAIRHGWQTSSTRVMARLLLGGKGIAWNRGTELDPTIEAAAAAVVAKRVQDAFENAELDRLLAKLQVGRLELAGLDGCYCVAKTALGALNRKFTVVVLRRCVMTSAPDRWNQWCQIPRSGLSYE